MARAQHVIPAISMSITTILERSFPLKLYSMYQRHHHPYWGPSVCIASSTESSYIILTQAYPDQTYEWVQLHEWDHLKAILRAWSFDSLYNQYIIMELFCGPQVFRIISAALVRKLQSDPLTRNTGIIYCIITPLNWKQLITWSRMHKWKFIRGKWWKMCPLL